jgi:hypothetical protein
LDSSEIAAKIKADLEASNAKLTANLNSLLKPEIPAAPQPVVVPAVPQPVAQPIATGSALPRHQIGGFRDRLSAPRR